ncbi:hypothetical protein [Paenibacillus sp. NPDC058071]|uniref:hypothetical protein n=1 Tax=Paenibacillus sp. NPDC058071 TaxID=3346326 RepID=UPI0036DE4A6A
MYNRFYVFFKFLSLIPFLRITDDENWGTLTRSSTKLRVSLLSFNFGPYYISFISRSFNRGQPSVGILKNWKWYYRIRLPIHKLSDEKKQRLWSDHLSFLEERTVEGSSKISAYKDALQYRLDQLKEKTNRTFNKFLAYLAVFAFLIPLYIPYILKINLLAKFPIYLAMLYVIPLGFIGYNLFQIMFFFHRFIKVKSSIRSKYKEIKIAVDPEIAHVNQLYIDYQQLDLDTTNEVTVIANIERYITGITMLSIIILGLYLGIPSNLQKPSAVTVPDTQTTTSLLHIDLKQSPRIFLDKHATTIQKLERDALNGEISQFILIGNWINNNEEYEAILQLIKFWNVENVPIIEVYDDRESEEGWVNLIWERR